MTNVFHNSTPGDVFLLNTREYASLVDKDDFYYLNTNTRPLLMRFWKNGVCFDDSRIFIVRKV